MKNIIGIIFELFKEILKHKQPRYFKKFINILKSLICVSAYLWIFIILNEVLIKMCIDIALYLECV